MVDGSGFEPHPRRGYCRALPVELSRPLPLRLLAMEGWMKVQIIKLRFRRSLATSGPRGLPSILS